MIASGRPKGSRNKLAQDFIDKVYEDWQAHGAKAIIAMREQSPSKYCTLVAATAKALGLEVSPTLPVVWSLRDFCEGGGPISYGPDYPDMCRRSAELVDKILRGAKPADIPVSPPSSRWSSVSTLPRRSGSLFRITYSAATLSFR